MIKNIILIPKFNKVLRYQLRYAVILTCVPITISSIILFLLMVFTKLNLYHIESIGVLLDQQIRTAYYDRVIDACSAVLPELIYFFIAIFTVSFIVVKWSSSPFTRAESFIRRSLSDTSSLAQPHLNLVISEEPVFGHLIKEFTAQVISGAPLKSDVKIHGITHNFRYLIKFFLTFFTLSILTGIMFSSVFFVAYDKIVSLSIQLIQSHKLNGHYFNAQQEMLASTINVGIVFSLIAYFFIGRNIHRYMALNLFVFCKAITEKKFPIMMRRRELYQKLAEALNAAYAKHKENRT